VANDEKRVKKEIADDILGAVEKIIPGFGGFFEKAEKTKKFGPRMKKIREEINRHLGGLKK